MPKTKRTVGPGKVQLDVPMTQQARSSLRSRSSARGSVTMHSIRRAGATSGDTGGDYSNPVTLRRR